MRLEPQRLLAHGPSTLPADVVVDCGAVLRAVAGDAASPVWAQLADVSRASGRSFHWVVAPMPTPDPNVHGASLGALAQALAGLSCASILRSDEPLIGLLRVAPRALRDMVVVTAEIEDHVHELVVLDMDGVTAALDVATGRLWDRAAVEQDYGVEPAALPELEAIAGHGPGRRPVVGVAHVGRHRADIAAAISKGDLAEQAQVPTSIGKGISGAGPQIANRVEMLRGVTTPDVTARCALEAKLARPPPSPAASVVTSAPFRPSTAYVLADVDVAADPLRFREAAVIVGGHPQHAKGHADVIALLREVHRAEPLRWFVPRALDVLGCLVDAREVLPDAAADPAHALYLLDPDFPPTLPSTCPSARTFDEDLSSWFGGVDRSVPAAAGALERLDALPAIDAELQDAMRRASVLKVFETDIAATIPVLAHIERQGAWVAPPHTCATWKEFEAATHQEIEHHERIFLPFIGAADPYSASLQGPVLALRGHAWLTPTEAGVCRSYDEELDRLAKIGFAPAEALRQARRLTAMLSQWVRPLSAGAVRARAHMGPERTGLGRLDRQLVVVPKVRSLAELPGVVDGLLGRTSLQRVWITWLLEELEAPLDAKDAVRRRWLAMRGPNLAEFSPYAAHCVRAFLLLVAGMQHGVLTKRPSNRIDIEYLLYLPFCEVFVSADRLHDQLAPLLARDDQSILKHDAFRADLQRRLAARDALDADARARREFAFGSYPWPLRGSTLTDLWRKHHGPWGGSGNRAVKLSAAEQERALADARALVAASSH